MTEQDSQPAAFATFNKILLADTIVTYCVTMMKLKIKFQTIALIILSLISKPFCHMRIAVMPVT
jgi:hypothetical protein